MKRFAVGLFLSVPFAPAYAASDEAILRGAGGQTCAQFAQDYASDPSLIEPLYFSWAQGYMSGINAVYRLEKKRLRTLGHGGADDQTQRIFIRSYCDAHPLAAYWQAVEELYKTLSVAK